MGPEIMKENTLLYTDDLTGVYNRRYLHRLKHEIIPGLSLNNTVFSLVITDIDHFKEINDTYGHLKGDEAIKHYAEFLKKNLRKEDVIIRYGGDEFVIIQKNLSKEDAYLVWERLIEKLRNHPLGEIQLSISAGIAFYPEDSTSFDRLFAIADNRLYAAKRSGRGRVGRERLKTISLPPPKFVDRRNEVELLKKGIEDKKIVLIKGEAGIGKTRIIKEVLSTLKNKNVLWSDCLAFERKIPYYPFREILKYKVSRAGKKFIERLPLSLRVELAKLLPSLSPEEVEQGHLLDSRIDRYRFFEGVFQSLSGVTEDTLIVIDNIQWIDNESIEVLRYIIRKKPGNLHFIFAMRSEETSIEIEQFLSELTRDNLVYVVEMHPLKDTYVKELVNTIIGDSLKELEDYIMERCAGNPFYVEETIKALYDEGFLKVKANEWVFSHPGKDILPRGVDDVVRRKFYTLREETQNLLKVLSVAGKGYIELLIKLTGIPEGQLFDILEEGIKTGLIVEDEDGEYVRFKSELIRNSIYTREISNIKKRRLHRVIAEWISQNTEEGNEEELAFHYYMAKEKSKLIKYAEKAGDKAFSMYANRDAIIYYSWAKEGLESDSDLMDSLEYTKILLKISKVYEHIGEAKKARELLEKALSIFKEPDSEGILVEIYKVYASVLWTLGEKDKTFEIIKEGLKMARELNLKKGEILLTADLATYYQFAGDYEKALTHYSRSLEMAKEAGESHLTGTIMINLAGLYYYMGKLELSLETFNRAKKIIKNKKQLMDVYLNSAVVLDASGKFQEAIKNSQRALDLAQEIGDKQAEGLILNNIGAMYLALGEFERAEEFILKSMKIHTHIMNTEKLGFNYENLAYLYMAKGNIKLAYDYYKKSYEIAVKNYDKRGEILSLMTMGTIQNILGNFNEAERTLFKVLEESKNLDAPLLVVDTLKAIAHMYFDKGETEKAIGVMEEMEKTIKSNNLEEKLFEFELLQLRKSIEKKEYEYGSKIISELEKQLDIVEAGDAKLSYYLLKTRFLLEWKDTDAALKTLKMVEKLLVKYPDALFRAEFYFLKALALCKRMPERAKELFKKSLEIYEKAGVKTKLNELRRHRDKRCAL